MRTGWKLPSPARLSNDLLSNDYMGVAAEVAHQLGKVLRQSGGLTMGIDGATNVLSQSLSNVIMHSPLPYFIEFLRADLKRETTENLVAKIRDVLDRFRAFLRGAGFVKDDDDEFDLSAVLSFVSDSCNGMRALRTALQELALVLFAYGCMPHCLNNLCKDICALPRFKTFVKNCLFIAKAFKNVGMLRKLLEMLCVEKLGKVGCLERWYDTNAE